MDDHDAGSEPPTEAGGGSDIGTKTASDGDTQADSQLLTEPAAGGRTDSGGLPATDVELQKQYERGLAHSDPEPSARSFDNDFIAPFRLSSARYLTCGSQDAQCHFHRL